MKYKGSIEVQMLMAKKGQKQFLISQMIASVYNNIVTGVLMTGLLLYIGVKPSDTGIFLSIPLLANVLQIGIGGIWRRNRDYKRTINRIILISRLGITSIVFIPLIFGRNGGQVTTAITAITGIILGIAYILASSAGIRLNYWMVGTIEPETQGTFFALRDKVVVGITTLISMGAAGLIDLLTKVHMEYLGFAVAFFLAGVCAVCDYIVLNKIEPPSVFPGEQKKERVDYLRLLTQDRRFLFFVVYMFLLNFSLNLANPYFNSYMLEELKLEYVQILLLTAMQILIQIGVASRWGMLANKIRWMRILFGTSFTLGLQFFVWAFVTRQTLPVIVIIFMTSGLISTGLVTGQFMVPFEFVNKKNKVLSLSLSTCIASCGGFIGSVAGSQVIKSLENIKLTVGIVKLEAMQINMMISGAAILGTTLYAKLLLMNKDMNE